MTRPQIVACVVGALLAAIGPACEEDETATAPALSATCEARPPSGLLPLTVSFDAGGEARHGDQCRIDSVVVTP